MTNTTTAPTFVVTACPFHGTTEVVSLDSLRLLVEVANECVTIGPHTHDHGVSCWVCCPSVVIDPDGILD